MARVCVVGSVNLDQHFTVTTLPLPGETVLATSVMSSPGGKGANQAIAAARAGATVQLVAALGTDEAAATLRRHLDANGVGLDAVTTVSGPSGAAVIVVDAAAENTIVVAPGANARLDVPAAEAVIIDADVLLLQLEIPLPAALAAARLARAAGVTVILNASPSAPDADLAELAAATDVVVVNESEAHRWRWPVSQLVTTLGSRGAQYRGTETAFEVSAPRVNAVDSTGAGDVFAGVLAAHWHRGARSALRRAVTAGALATLVPGAGDCAPSATEIDTALSITRQSTTRRRRTD